MTKKRRHHYVPRFYLDGFVDLSNEPYIWVYEKGNPDVIKATAENIAVEKDYYSYTTAEGEKDSETLENIFAEVEGRTAPVFQKIRRHQCLDGQERGLFALFIALMMVRVPNLRKSFERSGEELAKRYSKMLASDPVRFKLDIEECERSTGKKIGVPVERVREFMLGDKYEIKVQPHYSLGLLMMIEELVPIFYDMSWAFLGATDQYKFVTSDNPLFYCDPTHDPESFWGVGLLNKNIEVTFPMSRDLMLLATWQKLEGYTQLDNELVRDINRRPVASASRFVFASQKSDELNQLVQEYKNSAPRLKIEPSPDDLFVIRFVPPKL